MSNKEHRNKSTTEDIMDMTFNQPSAEELQRQREEEYEKYAFIEMEMAVPRDDYPTLGKFDAELLFAKLTLPRPEKHGLPNMPYQYARSLLDELGLGHHNLVDHEDIFVDVGGDDGTYLNVKFRINRDRMKDFMAAAKENRWDFQEVGS